MNLQLIPAPDMLGLPAHPVLLLVLLNATLALHWVFVGAVLGGTLIVLHNAVTGRGDATRARLNQAILSFLPFMLSMGVTLGVAPLLFVQVLYGHFFYAANVMMALWWLLIIPLVVGTTYLFYVAKLRLSAGRALGPLLPAILAGMLLVLAMILSGNMTLFQTPSAWESVWRLHGAGFFHGGGMVGRVIFAVFGFAALGAMFVLFLGKMGLAYDEEADRAAIEIGLRAAPVCIGLQLAAGILLVVLLPAEQRKAVFNGSLVSLFSVLSIGCLAGSLVLFVKARKSPTLSALVVPTAVYVVGLILIAFARDGIRRAALAPHFQLGELAIHPQWGPFALFLGMLVVAAAAVITLLRLARQTE
ncbi:MAG: hypothetical protein N3D11_11610 [Candidatus Sumerlaeia bacterium]|nr:hypothetical protein [Candidatus Sumerlaeia bacterium]